MKKFSLLIAFTAIVSAASFGNSSHFLTNPQEGAGKQKSNEAAKPQATPASSTSKPVQQEPAKPEAKARPEATNDVKASKVRANQSPEKRHSNIKSHPVKRSSSNLVAKPVKAKEEKKK
jgi:hypothetical protein